MKQCKLTFNINIFHNEFFQKLGNTFLILKLSNTQDNKSDIKCPNTLGSLDRFMCRGFRLWNGRDREAVYVYKYMQRIETVKRLRLWSSLGSHGYYVFSLVVVYHFW